MYRVITGMAVAVAILAADLAVGNAAPKRPANKAKPAAAPSDGNPVMPANPPSTWLTFHLAHPGPGGTMPADPNCAIFWKGKYHLHYIYQFPNQYGHRYAHVSSDDMLHWKWHPTSLGVSKTGRGLPPPASIMFSGTAFLTKEGRPAIIYHGQGSRHNQICIALDDNLDHWTDPQAIEAKTKSGEPAKIVYWDPDCWLMGDTYYAISGGKPCSLMKSTDLKNWVYLGNLLSDEMPNNLGVSKNEDISCANMFKLGKKWMLLCISHGLGCRYYLGDFKNEKYLPDFHGRMNFHGRDFFAPESLLTPDGRRVMWAWLFFGRTPGLQGGIQSLPRELSLPDDGVLRIKPLRELDTLRYDEKSESNITVKSDAAYPLKEISGDTLELDVAFERGAAQQFGVEVYCDKEGKGGFPIAIDPAAKTMLLGAGKAAIKVPFTLKPDEDVALRVYLDKSVVEVFANDRQAAVALHTHSPEDVGISLFSKGGDTVATDVKGWKMKSIYAPEEAKAAK